VCKRFHNDHAEVFRVRRHEQQIRSSKEPRLCFSDYLAYQACVILQSENIDAPAQRFGVGGLAGTRYSQSPSQSRRLV
jgi:hypothetical protein